MLKRDYRDIVAGGLLLLLGVAIALYSVSHYALGTVTRMGAGMVPTSLGVLLAVLGAIIGITAISREGVMPDMRIATPILILVSIFVFGVMIVPFGLLPAIFFSVLVASAAELTFRPIISLVLALGLCLLAYLIFSVGLRLTIPLFAWPF